MEHIQPISNDFFLQKWFLDCVTDDGNAMIFYAAKLKWKKWEVPYVSWLVYHPKTGLSYKSRYKSVKFPVIKNNFIFWNDEEFKISGEWKTLSAPVQDRIFTSEEGNLNWHCCQPSSKVNLKIAGKEISGIGYAEELRLTIAPWKIPMSALRWGRFSSEEDQLVWIEMIGDKKQQWLWFNGEKIENAVINDQKIAIPSKDICLELEDQIALESEKKILKVVRELLAYLPGFNKTMTANFLAADEYKWLSRGILKKSGEIINRGWVIHEFINFNPSKK